jgi:hypothetical protein
MALPKNIVQREHNKFEEDVNGDIAVRTIPSGGQSVSPLAQYMERVLTSATVETYTYYESASKVTLYNTVVVTYVASDLEVILNVAWS